jgi:uncharacterized protein
MNLRLPSCALLVASMLLATTPLAHAAESTPSPLLRGILIDAQGQLFSLSDATGAGTWAKLGDSFQGWQLKEFDAKRQVLTLVRDSQTREISPEGARIATSETPATTGEADALLNKMRFDEMIEKSLKNQQLAMSKSMGQMQNGMGLSKAESEEMAQFQAKVMQVMLAEMDIPGMRSELARAMTEIYTPAELRAQTDFYSTSVGQGVIDKQPALQSRMTELMMPRMMKAMPKIQAMSMEYAKSKAVKKTTAAEPVPATP